MLGGGEPSTENVERAKANTLLSVPGICQHNSPLTIVGVVLRGVKRKIPDKERIFVLRE